MLRFFLLFALLSSVAYGESLEEYMSRVHYPRQIVSLCMAPSIAAEIDLSQEQLADIKAIHKTYLQKCTEAASAAEDAYPFVHRARTKAEREQNEKFRQMLSKLRRKIDGEWGKELENVLLPAQVVRLNEIQVQYLGFRVFRTPSLQAVLGLTADQRARIEEINRLRVANEDEVYGSKAQWQGQNQAAFDAVVSLLTNKQKETLKKLRGAPSAYVNRLRQ